MGGTTLAWGVDDPAPPPRLPARRWGGTRRRGPAVADPPPHGRGGRGVRPPLAHGGQAPGRGEPARRWVEAGTRHARDRALGRACRARAQRPSDLWLACVGGGALGGG